MANWDGKNTPKNNVNNNNQFEPNDAVVANDINACFNNSFFAADFATHLADTPDTTEVRNVGTPSVQIVNGATATANDGSTIQYKKFKFSNLKGAKGDTGAAAGFGTPTATASTLAAGSSATASVSASAQSPNTAKVFNFTFGIPKGDKGENSLEMKQALPDSTSFVVGGTFTISNNKFNRLPVIGDTFNAIIYKTTDTSTYILGMEIQSVSGTYASGSSVAQIVYYNNLKGNTGAAATINNSTTKGLNMAVTTDNSNNILGLTITVTTV